MKTDLQKNKKKIKFRTATENAEFTAEPAPEPELPCGCNTQNGHINGKGQLTARLLHGQLSQVSNEITEPPKKKNQQQSKRSVNMGRKATNNIDVL